jgi:hypothetical protein
MLRYAARLRDANAAASVVRPNANSACARNQRRSHHHRFLDLLRQTLGFPKQLLTGAMVSVRVGGPAGQRRDQGKCPWPAAVACITDGSDVVLARGGVVAACPGAIRAGSGPEPQVQVLRAIAASS